MIVVLNFGSQFAHLIARRVRDLGVKAEIFPFDTPASVDEKNAPHPDKNIFELGIPILGICYGLQLMGEMLEGAVERGEHREYGKETLRILKKDALLKGLGAKEIVWFSHGDQVTQLPKDFVKTASTHGCSHAAFADAKRKMYGIQFHPEVTHTVHGTKILSNFLFGICKAKKDWNISSVAKGIIEKMQETVGNEQVVIGISGGVDSLVAATLLYKAIGERLHAVFVDTGLLRKDEVEGVSKALRARGFKNLHVVDASADFLGKLKGVSDPEEKRKIIGHTFIEVFERALEKELAAHPVTFLAQGTIYPDRIESAATSKDAAKIKSHHNLTLPETMKLKVLEPVADLYKDEVRKIGKTLNIPHEMLWRHPFPGPGLAIRIVGEITPERLSILREADSIFTEELKKAKEYEKIWQAFAVLLPIKSVGVMGDARTYEYMLALRAVDSVDGMTADWHKMPPVLLEKISSAIVGKVRGINRVLYDITQKPPATIEYE